MLSATGSWRRRGSNGRFAASKPLDVQLTWVGVVLDRFIRTSPRDAEPQLPVCRQFRTCPKIRSQMSRGLPDCSNA